MGRFYALIIFVWALVSPGFTSCTSAKRESLGARNALFLFNPLPIASPVSDDVVASLKAIADSPNASLPPLRQSEDESAEETELFEELNVLAETNAEAPDAWRGPGLNPEEVNPGDIFSENQGPMLRKLFSLLDELPATDRGLLLDSFTRSTRERVPVTISRAEIAELEKTSTTETPLPSRSVALDFRTVTHSIENNRHVDLLAAISKGGSAGSITSEARLARLKNQLNSVKKRLRAGETLYVVIAVAESTEIQATYPGAPIGRRDSELVQNALVGTFPHLRNLETTKDNDSIKITGNPRILWEFDTREVKLEGEKLVIDHESVVRM